jgi:NAD(P) transhydrogenase subunit alpha
LYARNVVNLLTLLTQGAAPAKDDKAAVELAINLNFDDEIINGAALTHGGARRTPEVKAAK